MRFSIIKKNKAFQKSHMKVGVKKLLHAGMMPARTWRVHAVEMGPTERLQLRRQVAAAAGKKSTTSLSLFMEAYGLAVQEELSTLATQYWAEGTWTGKWYYEQCEVWMEQIQEVQSWKQVRGPAGAVMCETRDLGIKWPQWHTLIFEGEVNIVMRYVFPKDVKKMLLQQARTVCWKKWAAKHEYEELKEGILLEPALALLRKKAKGEWTEKHRNVARKLLLEGGWVQQRLFDIVWSDESECQA